MAVSIDWRNKFARLTIGIAIECAETHSDEEYGEEEAAQGIRHSSFFERTFAQVLFDVEVITLVVTVFELVHVKAVW